MTERQIINLIEQTLYYKMKQDEINKFNSFYENRFDYLKDLYINEYVIIKEKGSDKTLDEYRFDGSDLVRLKLPSSKVIKAENVLQRCALDMLNNNDIKICALLGTYGCVDGETEYFNGKGWVKFSDYKEGDKVLSYDTETDSAILCEPIRYIKIPCKKLFHFSDGLGIDQCLSPEHNILYKSQNRKYQKSIFSEFMRKHNSSRNGFNAKFYTTFYYSGGDTEIPVTDLCEICSLIINNELRETDFYEYRKRWYNIPTLQYKIVKDCILDLTRNSSRKLNRFQTLLFTTNIKEGADFIQFAFEVNGIRLSVDDNGDGSYNIIRYREPLSNMCRLMKRPKMEFEEVNPFDGYKYCFTVPTGNLVVRRKGCIVITSNSGKTYLSLKMAFNSVCNTGKQAKILGVREPIGEGKEVGFLKGDFEDKTNLFFLPLVQSLDGGEYELQSRVDRGQFESQIPYYLKGTTYNDTIIVCDEAEDLSERQIRLIGTRLGKDSRIFFSGDYKQGIFNSGINNPLLKMCEELKGNPNFACIVLDDDVRSETSKIFANLFKK